MAEQAKVEAPAAEAPVEKSARETIEDSLESTDAAPVDAAPESTDVAPEAEAAAEDIVPGEEAPAEEAAPEAEPESEAERIIRENEETPNVQKRIDALTAKIKALEAEKAQAKEKPAEKEKKVYTEEQLAHAMMKAVEENNPALMRDVIAEIRSGVKDELVKMYNDEKNAGKAQVEALTRDWEETVDAYSKYADTKIPEIWPGSHKDLNLPNTTSMLYQIAMALYWNKDPQKAAYYQKPGGQKQAVADALTYLIRTKAGKSTDTKVRTLKNALTKERMKKSPVTGGPSGVVEKTPKATQTENERLEEVINERKQYQAEREQ
jgi:hypothetical protein